MQTHDDILPKSEVSIGVNLLDTTVKIIRQVMIIYVMNIDHRATDFAEV